jgi:hypothetical protein
MKVYDDSTNCYSLRCFIRACLVFVMCCRFAKMARIPRQPTSPHLIQSHQDAGGHGIIFKRKQREAYILPDMEWK